MKQTFVSLCVVVLLALTATGCEDEVESLSTDSSAIDRVKVGDLTSTLQILNMQGQPQTQFEEGENFQFQFIIENRGDSAYVLPVYWGFPFLNKDFFALYRKTQESGGVSYLGKSFQPGANTNDLAFASIPANRTSIYTMPWLTEKDTPYIMPVFLPASDLSNPRQYVAIENPPSSINPGEYFTGFTLQYNETDSARLEVSFSIN